MRNVDVLAEIAANGVPRRSAESGAREHDAGLVGGRPDAADHSGAALRGAVQEDEKWQGTLGSGGRHLNQRVAFAAGETERTGPERGSNVQSWPGGQPGIAGFGRLRERSARIAEGRGHESAPGGEAEAAPSEADPVIHDGPVCELSLDYRRVPPLPV